ncbi:phragmoplastin interacting protein 1 isoform X2 [Andrographis paniculata]|uniref:phragmoplastin interacting protein 1 isoform X2 n=1 Tax=Andrographis paniculata TaxID=175694 RepID=UPI0021E729AE|nr:phragmoplastin interacting protein 1 isoform X2 [Andrographis paniculata]
MVLSNKKLKQKLRAAKAELLAAGEAQKNTKLGSTDTKELQSLKILMNTEAKKPVLSKREKQRQKAENNPEVVKQKQTAGGRVEEKNRTELKSDGEVKRKKRKRDESEAVEKVKEINPAQVKKKKKKTKNKKKPKNNVESKEVKEVHNPKASQANGAAEACPNTERKELEPSTKVYVGGIPYYSTEDDIRSYFESCGSITDVDCMEFPDTGKFRGIAIVSFKTEAAAKRALALDGSDMGGLFLKIQPFKSSSRAAPKSSNFFPAVVDGYNRIYIGNLSWDVSEADLRKLFSDCTITSIRFGEDKETGEFKGYAHIDFADSLSLNMALKLDQTIVCGRPVRISCAVPPKKGTIPKSKPAPKENHSHSDKVSSTTKDENISDAMVSAVSKVQENSGTNLAPTTIIEDKVKNSSANVMPKSNVQESHAETPAVSSKIRRRTCYECGEKGHISSLCPKKQPADTTNTNTAA